MSWRKVLGIKKKKKRSGHVGILSGYRVKDRISKKHRYIHVISYHYKIDAENALERMKLQKQDVIMRKYRDANNHIHYGIFRRSAL